MNILSKARSVYLAGTALGVVLMVSAGTAMAHGGGHYADRHYHNHSKHCDRHAQRHHRDHRGHHRTANYHRRSHFQMGYSYPQQYVDVAPSYSYQHPYYSGRRYSGGTYGSPNFGNAVGGAVGGYLGSTIGKGSGRLAATAAGAVIGYSIGGQLGHR